MKKIDFHVHVKVDLPPEETVAAFTDMCARHGYEGVNILAWTYDFPEKCNEMCLTLSKRIPNFHAFCCLLPGEDYAAQAERLMAMGFDGIKLIRGGKPSLYRGYGRLFDDEIYEDFFALAEEKQYPIIMHNNDPEANWDITRVSKQALEKGWYYDESLPSHERYFEAVDHVLEKHPRLKLAMAHMGFYSENIDKAFDMMEKYPNLYMDATPALNIYEELSLVRDKAELFFRTYSDRIFLGTDATNLLVGYEREKNDKKNVIVPYFLGGGAPATLYGLKIAPIRLEPYMLENIYYNTAMKFIFKETDQKQ